MSFCGIGNGVLLRSGYITLLQRLGMTDLIQPATDVRASLAYDPRNGQTVQADTLRRVRTLDGYSALVERAVTTLSPQDVSTWIGKVNVSASEPAPGEYLIARTSTVASSYLSTAVSYTAGSAYTISAEVKIGTVGNFFGLRIQTAYPNRADVVVNLTTGLIAYQNVTSWTDLRTTVKQLADGWIRVSLTATAPATASGIALVSPCEVAGSAFESASTILCNGSIRLAQVEQGPYATSQVPPGISTRAFDLPGAALSGLTYVRRNVTIGVIGDSFVFGANNQPGLGGWIADAAGCDTTIVGGGGKTTAQILSDYQGAPSAQAFPAVIICGYNDAGAGYADTVANIQAMVAEQDDGRHLVIGMMRETPEALAVNASLASAFGANYLDPHDVLGASNAPWLVDSTHLNERALQILAAAIRDKLLALGYLPAGVVETGLPRSGATILVCHRPVWSGSPVYNASDLHSLIGIPGTTSDNLILALRPGNAAQTNYIEMFIGDGATSVAHGAAHTWTAGQWSCIAMKWCGQASVMMHQISGSARVWETRKVTASLTGMSRITEVAIGQWQDGIVTSGEYVTWAAPRTMRDEEIEAASAYLLEALS